ncbi:MAG: hypothetical protein O7D95_02865 [Betaproteobacteria bacterium]|nr:hypothetical protein [Betaproteobacteria bacterium]
MRTDSPTEKEIRKVIFDPDIFNRITDDNSPKDFDLPKVSYIGIYETEIIALFIYWPFKDMYKAHFQVLKEHRMKAREIAKMVLDITPRPLFTEIPTLYRHYMNFIKKFGFKQITERKDAYLKNGINYDLIGFIL